MSVVFGNRVTYFQLKFPLLTCFCWTLIQD